MEGPGAPGPLLIACALGIEHLALRRGLGRPGPAPGGDGHGGTGHVRLLRSGMGPQAARRAVTGALEGEAVRGGTAVLATGFCAGLASGMRPGDLVVADETRDASGHTPCTGTELLAAALAPYGTVHTGPLAGSDHVVRGAERAALHSTGAIAADMESAATLGAAASGTARRPVAAVRVVVDAPGHELIRVGTLRGGISAFRVLRGVLPAFLEWHRSLLLPWR
ncbi:MULTISPECIES: 1-hydroxy-2-methyl-2-butenyl 4-diphosphate reductase [unclassified Streptomyces]|uniref:phosphorylase family protein n=1 Tax=unclassified Streptomyces TaxID=2593676 RepID=UPI002DDB6E29|nr:MULTISPECIES: 1-hydroxy-2-methyl-2-butenyl 4-diphosphate reductase [unclassified Streptomyces]WSA91081.1 1-hydroxy-2-methyl-2-butenyl 4-diphosphate reductase [Streptomyces sp. NBC_01795]WSB75406.1 1-hydroxy-2-methyl-2-butenyl 4-diphosphate reductase [Streptomyces sp. NBC_01775]WSS16312.1 1-hydroxy-2-methyl-2-butenyl 4-diphosphate reductase [Streptomyces sp. NBC_01186]WSS45129.1 1-hydroxy-2-methyl-2-butenyl 4-diphosphate reductase [Streptomyces sp. NBC_01187]